jgi:hypothetical protein
MTDHDSRRPLVRYAIAADLAVLATGIALIDPERPIFLVSVYVAAVAIAAWKGGWRAAALTIAVSVVAQLLLFRTAFDESHLVGFIAASAVATVIIESVSPRHTRPEKTEPDPAREYGKFFVVEPEPEAAAREPKDRYEIQRQLERAAAQQLAEQRAAARRAAEDNKVTPITPKPGTKRDGSKRG